MYKEQKPPKSGELTDLYVSFNTSMLALREAKPGVQKQEAFNDSWKLVWQLILLKNKFIQASRN